MHRRLLARLGVYLPAIFTTNAERYGLIGVAFGLVTWLFGYAAVVIGCGSRRRIWDHRRHAVPDAR